MPQAQITLTPTESKRLIAKAVAKLPEVLNAFRNGIVIVTVGTTNAFVAEELLGHKIDKEKFAAGIVLPKGTCVLPAEKRTKEIIIRKGKVVDDKMEDVLLDMTSNDVFIKGANALDPSWMAGVFLASRRGGTVGKIWGILISRGVNLIVAVGLEKFIPSKITDLTQLAGIDKASFSTGVPIGISPLLGKVITELEAINILTGADAIALGKGGISGAEGSVTLLVRGVTQQLARVKQLVTAIKCERYPTIETDCATCDFPCPLHKKRG
jgi:hypothetical protein